MKFFDADYSVTEFKINNKLIGYIPENFYPRHLDPLLEKMSKKPSWSENGCNSWGEPEYLPAQKKFLMYIKFPNNTTLVSEIIYDSIKYDDLAAAYGECSFNFYSSNHELIYKIDLGKSDYNLDYIINDKEELVGAIFSQAIKSSKTSSSSSYSYSNNVSIDSFMRDNNYDPEIDTIEDMYNLD